MRKLRYIVLLLSIPLVLPAQEEAKPFDAFKHLEIYNAALRELELNHVDTLDHEFMLQMALDRICYELDPYTVFIPEDDNDMVKRLSSGQYGGVGSAIMKLGGDVYFTQPYYGMPAQANGLRAGDKIIAIDGQRVKGLSVSEVSERLRGAPGSEISVEVERVGAKKHIKTRFLRQLIQTETVPFYKVVADNTGYVVINDFIDRTYVDFAAAVADMVEKGAIDKLIIDLRGNGGGIVGQAVRIASLFVPKGTEIVSIRGRRAEGSRVYSTDAEPLYPDMRLAFLVDGGTASSSEILAGALQDLDRAVLVGQRTVGKGLVQSVRHLPYNTYIKLTTAKHYLPSGRCIQAIDYSNNADHADRVIPDSLTTEFFTRNGRSVRDNSGLCPDSLLEEQAMYNISAYMLSDMLYFKYANQFVAKNPQIAPATEFSLSDAQYQDFCDYVLAENYTYRLVSERYLQSLRQVVDLEDNEERASALLDSLSQLLRPNVKEDLVRFRPQIVKYLENEIVSRYYYQAGAYQLAVRSDDEITAVVAILKSGRYDEMLKAGRK